MSDREALIQAFHHIGMLAPAPIDRDYYWGIVWQAAQERLAQLNEEERYTQRSAKPADDK